MGVAAAVSVGLVGRQRSGRALMIALLIAAFLLAADIARGGGVNEDRRAAVLKRF